MNKRAKYRRHLFYVLSFLNVSALLESCSTFPDVAISSRSVRTGVAIPLIAARENRRYGLPTCLRSSRLSTPVCYILFLSEATDGNLFFLNCTVEHRRLHLFDILYAIELGSNNDGGKGSGRESWKTFCGNRGRAPPLLPWVCEKVICVKSYENDYIWERSTRENRRSRACYATKFKRIIPISKTEFQFS